MPSGETPRFLSLLGQWHDALVFQRRVQVLGRMLGAWIPPSSHVLDVGCGDGTIGLLLTSCNLGVAVEGVEFSARPGCKIPCTEFDGRTLPFASGSFDVCVLVDVLHHTTEPRVLLREVARVSRRCVLIKDHLRENAIDGLTLGLMDWLGNRPHGVVLTYNYQSRAQWNEHFAACGLSELKFTSQVPLYPPPVSWVAGRGLHFISLLEKLPPPA